MVQIINAFKMIRLAMIILFSIPLTAFGDNFNTDELSEVLNNSTRLSKSINGRYSLQFNKDGITKLRDSVSDSEIRIASVLSYYWLPREQGIVVLQPIKGGNFPLVIPFGKSLDRSVILTEIMPDKYLGEEELVDGYSVIGIDCQDHDLWIAFSVRTTVGKGAERKAVTQYIEINLDTKTKKETLISKRVVSKK